MWLDHLQLYLLSDSRDSVSLFDHTSSAAPAPPTTADSAARSQWLTRDAAARLATRNHLPLAECAHFGQNKTAQTLYDAVVARYSLPTTSTLGRLLLPYLFPEVSAFATVADLDVTFDESVPFYHLFLAPGPPPVDPLPPKGPAPSGVSHVDPLPGTAPVEVAVGSGLGVLSVGLKRLGVAEHEGMEPGGAEAEGAEFGGAEPRGTASSGGPAGASTQQSPQPEPLSPHYLRKWFAQRTHLRSGAAGAGDSAARDTGAGGARTRGTGAAGTGGDGGAGAGDPTDPGAAGARGAGAGGTGVGGAGAGGAGAVHLGARGAGGTVRQRPYFVPLLQQPASPLPAPSPYTEHTGGLTERREPSSHPASPVRSGRRVPHPRPPLVPSTHAMALRPSSVPLCVPLPPPPESSLPVSLPLNYATALYAESESASPPSVGGECALGTDVFEDRQEDLECLAAAVPRFASMLLAPEGDPDAPVIPTPRSYAEAITSPYSSQWQAAMDAEMASWKSKGTYVDAVPPSRANIVDGMWIFRVKWTPGSPPAFKARYVARGFSPQQGVDYFQTFSPTLKMTTLRVLLHVAAQRDYELFSLDFSTAFLQGSLQEEIWLRRPHGFTRSFPAGTQWSLRRPVYSLRQAPPEWDDTLRTTLAALGFTPSTADPARFQQDLPVLHLYSDYGGEFSSALFEDFCHEEGITQPFTLPTSPQHNGIVEHHIGLIMEVARTSMIHAAAPHFMWLFAVRYAAHQLKLWPRVSQPETSPTVLWTEEFGDASAFRTPLAQLRRVYPAADNTAASSPPTALGDSSWFYASAVFAASAACCCGLWCAGSGGADPEGPVSGGAERPSGGGIKGTTAGGSAGESHSLPR
ncbi:unnamed protein product [Closterium sp. NIES-54]